MSSGPGDKATTDIPPPPPPPLPMGAGPAAPGLSSSDTGEEKKEESRLIQSNIVSGFKDDKRKKRKRSKADPIKPIHAKGNTESNPNHMNLPDDDFQGTKRSHSSSQSPTQQSKYPN